MTKKTDETQEKFKKEIEEWRSKYLRALADYQNLEKRVSDQRQEIIQYAEKELIVKLLSVLDTFEKTREHLKDQGLTLAVDNFWKVLKEAGVEKIDVFGKKFDPVTMECIEVAGDGKGDEVIEELRSGYKLGDKVIRVAQVKVGKKNIN